MRAIRGVIVAAVSISMVALSPSLAHAAGDDVQPVDFTHNTVDAPAPVPGAVFGTAPAVKTGTAICTTAAQLAANANTDISDILLKNINLTLTRPVLNTKDVTGLTFENVIVNNIPVSSTQPAAKP